MLSPSRDALADEDADVAGERGVGIVDRLVLTDHAAKLGRQRPGARLERRVFHQFVRLHRERRPGAERKQKREQRRNEAPGPHSAAAATAPARARTPTPKRSRRSASDSAPPRAIAAPPSQISVTNGFQYSRAGTSPPGVGSAIDT